MCPLWYPYDGLMVPLWRSNDTLMMPYGTLITPLWSLMAPYEPCMVRYSVLIHRNRHSNILAIGNTTSFMQC
jgi:hypothetical protein